MSSTSRTAYLTATGSNWYTITDTTIDTIADVTMEASVDSVPSMSTGDPSQMSSSKLRSTLTPTDLIVMVLCTGIFGMAIAKLYRFIRRVAFADKDVSTLTLHPPPPPIPSNSS